MLAIVYIIYADCSSIRSRNFDLQYIKVSIRMSEPQSKKVKMTSSLTQLKEITTIVADTGDFQGN